jgi:hypothetical protein
MLGLIDDDYDDDGSWLGFGRGDEIGLIGRDVLIFDQGLWCVVESSELKNGKRDIVSRWAAFVLFISYRKCNVQETFRDIQVCILYTLPGR